MRAGLIRSCSQHVPEKAVNLADVLAQPVVDPIHRELEAVCQELGKVRLSHGGKKTYHLMVGCYFLDLANVLGSIAACLQFPIASVLCGGRFGPVRGLRTRYEMAWRTGRRGGLPVVCI